MPFAIARNPPEGPETLRHLLVALDRLLLRELVEAAAFLEDTMAASGKLDPVLVDLYIDFLRTQGVEVPASRGFRQKLNAP